MAKKMSIQVRTGEVRVKPSFLGKIVARLAYGEQVTLSGQKGDWMKVVPTGGRPSGWIHGSALTTKKIVFQAGSANVSAAADSSEVALAGKGFSRQVEDAYRRKNRQLDFRSIDQMERVTISPAQIERFLKEGGLKPVEGGA
jgi:hypothetical protein